MSLPDRTRDPQIAEWTFPVPREILKGIYTDWQTSSDPIAKMVRLPSDQRTTERAQQAFQTLRIEISQKHLRDDKTKIDWLRGWADIFLTLPGKERNLSQRILAGLRNYDGFLFMFAQDRLKTLESVNMGSCEEALFLSQVLQ